MNVTNLKSNPTELTILKLQLALNRARGNITDQVARYNRINLQAVSGICAHQLQERTITK